MKKIFIFAIALVTLSLTSCEKFLDVTKEGEYTTDAYFQNDQQAMDALKFFYAKLPTESLYGREICWEQCATNMYVSGRQRGYKATLFTLNYSGDESPLTDSFGTIYEQISRANWVVSSLLAKEETTALSAIESRSLGEAYFFRAFLHNLAAARYGCGEQGVPFIAWESVEGGYNYEIPTQQPSVKDNYALIIDDLKKAADRLPKFETYGASDRGRAHKAAAYGLMARVYANWATWDATKWSDVITAVNECEALGRKLEPSFDRLFSCEFEDFWTDEYLFTIPSNGGATTPAGCMFPCVVFNNKGYGMGFNGWGQFKPSYDLYEEFLKDGPREENVRLKRTVMAYGDELDYNGQKFAFFDANDDEAGFMCAKYLDAFAGGTIKDRQAAGYLGTDDNWPTQRINYHLLRFADCVLLRAEANINLGNTAAAITDINKVRDRAGLAQDSKGAIEEIYHERMCEFAFEPGADHLIDLKRWAVSGKPEIKALAIKELTTQPRVLKHENRADAFSAESVIEYTDYNGIVRTWDNYKVAFPYPSAQISKSNNQLKQNPGW